MKKLLLIVNPRSGKQQAKKQLCDIIDVFVKNCYDVTVHITQCSKDAENVAEARAKDFDMIVACGGDGTLNETVSGLMKLKDNRPPLGYIPLGSTNDFAATLNLPSDAIEAAQVIANGSCHSIDVGKINGRYFNYIASAGAFTSASYSASQGLKNSIGHLAYITEGLKDIPNVKPFYAKVKIADKVFEDDYIFCAVCNTTSIAGLVKLDQKLVNLSDGLFETILIRAPKNAIELSKLAFSLTSKEYNEEFIKFVHSKSVQFTFDSPIPWSVDGEYYVGDTDIKIENKFGAVELVW